MDRKCSHLEKKTEIVNLHRRLVIALSKKRASIRNLLKDSKPSKHKTNLKLAGKIVSG